MSTTSISIKQKIRQVICCASPTGLDQNEGPPPPTAVLNIQAQNENQAVQTTNDMGDNTIVEENEQEVPEDEWEDDNREINPYLAETYVVEADKYGIYTYGKSDYAGIKEVENAYENFLKKYRPPDKTEGEDPTKIWTNTTYLRSPDDWPFDAQTNISGKTQEAR